MPRLVWQTKQEQYELKYLSQSRDVVKVRKPRSLPEVRGRRPFLGMGGGGGGLLLLPASVEV